MLYDQQVKLETEALDSPRPARRKVLLLSVVAGLLVAIGLIGFVVTIPARASREPTAEDQQLAEVCAKELWEEEEASLAVADDSNGTALELDPGHRRAQSCPCYTQLTAHRSKATAMRNCLSTVRRVGCRGCQPQITRVYQLVYGGNVYVNCRCCR
jgi:hypothetical protein